MNGKNGIERLITQQRERHGESNQDNRTMGQALSDLSGHNLMYRNFYNLLEL
jgi:hypothetical protein